MSELPPSPSISPPPPMAPAGMPDTDARNWATFTHLSGLVFLLGIPSFVGPLVMWLIKRQESPFVDAHGKEAVNFHLSLLIYAIVSGILVLILVGILLLIVVGILGLVASIIAAVKASNGETWRYPMTIRFIK